MAQVTLRVTPESPVLARLEPRLSKLSLATLTTDLNTGGMWRLGLTKRQTNDGLFLLDADHEQVFVDTTSEINGRARAIRIATMSWDGASAKVPSQYAVYKHRFSTLIEDEQLLIRRVIGRIDGPGLQQLVAASQDVYMFPRFNGIQRFGTLSSAAQAIGGERELNEYIARTLDSESANLRRFLDALRDVRIGLRVLAEDNFDLISLDNPGFGRVPKVVSTWVTNSEEMEYTSGNRPRAYRDREITGAYLKPLGVETMYRASKPNANRDASEPLFGQDIDSPVRSPIPLEGVYTNRRELQAAIEMERSKLRMEAVPFSISAERVQDGDSGEEKPLIELVAGDAIQFGQWHGFVTKAQHNLTQINQDGHAIHRALLSGFMLGHTPVPMVSEEA